MANLPSSHDDIGSSATEIEEKERENEEEKARVEWDFRLTAVVSSSSPEVAYSDVIGVSVFDPSDTFLATGGIARKIRVYNVNNTLLSTTSSMGLQGTHRGEIFNNALLSVENSRDLQDAHRGEVCPQDSPVSLDHGAACKFCICTPAKLSSLRWKPGMGSRVIGSGDYDGVVMEYDLERRVPVFERDEHGGRRVWSMDYSHFDPVLGGSGSDDGTMQMWDPRCHEDGKCLATVCPTKSRSPVCCVEFCPFGGPLVTAGCADRKVYAYDVRMMRDPLFVLEGHSNAITYVKFLNSRTIVTSSVDGSLRLWDTNEGPSHIRSYRGHVNSKRFVGLSVWPSGGLLCCGSEDNKVVVYDKRWGQPVWVYACDDTVRRCGDDDGFVSSVCWMQRGDDRCTLVAGGSDGVLRVFNGSRRI